MGGLHVQKLLQLENLGQLKDTIFLLFNSKTHNPLSSTLLLMSKPQLYICCWHLNMLKAWVDLWYLLYLVLQKRCHMFCGLMHVWLQVSHCNVKHAMQCIDLFYSCIIKHCSLKLENHKHHKRILVVAWLTRLLSICLSVRQKFQSYVLRTQHAPPYSIE